MSRLPKILSVVLALGCLMALARIVAVTGLEIPLDPNEGWNAYHSVAAMSGGHLYPGADSFLFNNYPPLSFYVVGAFGWLTGDDIVAGRIVSLLALLAVAAGIFIGARAMGAKREAASFAALWFASGMLVFTDYVGMDDPQLLGHAIAMLGFVLLLKERRVVGAALAMTVAGFVKHNLIAMPMAALIWLAIFDRRSAMRFALAGTAFSAIGLVAFRLAYGVDLLGQLNSPRLFSFTALADGVSNWLIWGGTGLVAMAALLLARRGDRYVALCAIYALVAVVLGAFFSGGAGVDMNAWFDAAIAVALGAALALEMLGPVSALIYVVPLVVGLGLIAGADWLERDFWLHPLADDARTARGDIAFLKARRGSALCEMPSLCYWAGKTPQADIFNLGQAYAIEARKDDALVRLIEARRFAAVQFDSMDDFALGPRVKQALERSYRVEHEDDDGVFLVPRR